MFPPIYLIKENYLRTHNYILENNAGSSSLRFTRREAKHRIRRIEQKTQKILKNHISSTRTPILKNDISVDLADVCLSFWGKTAIWPRLRILQPQRAPGFEPGTSRSAVKCSTTELYPPRRWPFLPIWSTIVYLCWETRGVAIKF